MRELELKTQIAIMSSINKYQSEMLESHEID